MKRHLLFAVLILSAFVLSCKEQAVEQETANKQEIRELNIDPTELENDFMKWWSYHSYNINLSSNFTGMDENSDTIPKQEFLGKLQSGDFIPIRLRSDAPAEKYQLHKLGPAAEKGIRSTIKNESITTLQHFAMEGQAFPEFDLKDLDGNRYTNENTQGKTIIFKTWFIHCQACVAEFPELNELVEHYRDRDDVIFVSLALDAKDELRSFLQKQQFTYAVVPDQKELIAKQLQLQIYPTHIVVNGNGNITKVVNKASEMISFLEHTQQMAETNPRSSI